MELTQAAGRPTACEALRSATGARTVFVGGGHAARPWMLSKGATNEETVIPSRLAIRASCVTRSSWRPASIWEMLVGSVPMAFARSLWVTPLAALISFSALPTALDAAVLCLAILGH